MSHTRPYIIDILHNEFKKPEKKTELCAVTQHALIEKSGKISRMFDTFPCLLPDNIFQPLNKKFIQTLSEIKVSMEDDGLFLREKNDQDKVVAWIKEVAHTAIKEILNSDGHIRMELINLLGWENFKNQLDRSQLTLSILCAYISNIIAVATIHSQKEILPYNLQYSGFCQFITTNNNAKIYECLLEELDSANHIFTDTQPKKEYKSISNNILQWPTENPRTTSIVVLTATAALSSVMFFKRPRYKTNCIELEELKPHRFEAKL